MTLQQIKSFFSVKEQIKVIHDALKTKDKNYFSLLMMDNKIVNPYIMIKAYRTFKKDIPQGVSYWWSRKTYWANCVITGFLSLSSLLSIYLNPLIGSIIFVPSFFYLIFLMSKNLKDYVDFCHLLFREEENVKIFESWIHEEYSKIERKIILKEQHVGDAKDHSGRKRL